MKKAFSLRRLCKSFSYAFNGFKRVYIEEPNMKVHTLAAMMVIILGFLLKVSKLEWIFLVFAIGLVIGAEVLNTSIENLVDLATEEFHKKAMIAKDTAAAYVMVLSITAAIIGLIIFVPKIVEVLWKKI